ncbi:MAG: hypothetical protein JNM43_27090 [Planctomycetaceae bacterium]|nr:hypothetical protein [Planctomycetaceae bacterium]
MITCLSQRTKPWQKARFVTCLAWSLCALIAGCKVYPEPERKSINELYFEALAANTRTPEQTLGANPSAGSTMIAGGATGPRNPKATSMQPQSIAEAPTVSTNEQPQTEVPPVPPESALPLIPPSEAEPAAAAPLMTVPGPSDSGTSTPSLPSADIGTTLQGTAVPRPRQGAELSVNQDSAWSSTLVVSADRNSAGGWKKRQNAFVRSSGVQPVSHSSQELSSAIVLTSHAAGNVTESFDETDIRQALQLIASQAGVTVIVDENVEGSVTTLIENEPFETALKKVVLPLGLIFRKTGPSEYIVATSDPASPLFSRVADRNEYRPLHLGPDELVKLLPAREAKYVTVIDKRNLLIIEAPQEISAPILDRLRAADNPIPQVELEAIVCVIAPDRSFKSGLDWGHAVTLNGSDLFRIGMTGLAISGAGSGTGTSDAFSSFAVTSTFVKLLAQEGYLTIRAAPRVTARDGEPAKIAITRQSFFATQPNSANAFFRQELQDVEAGITLEITPVVRGENITVKIEKAEVSEDIRTTDVNANIANNPYPLINRRSVATTVNVKDEETIVIGGLVQRQTVDRIARIPVLGSIPYAGRMFQTVEKLEQDAEVVIFISPRIVTSGPACTAATTPAPVSPADGFDVPN